MAGIFKPKKKLFDGSRPVESESDPELDALTKDDAGDDLTYEETLNKRNTIYKDLIDEQIKNSPDTAKIMRSIRNLEHLKKYQLKAPIQKKKKKADKKESA